LNGRTTKTSRRHKAGELLALEALIDAAIGQREQALMKIARVDSLTNDPTPSLHAELASLVLQVADSSQRDTTQKRLADLIDEAARFGHLDVFVTAYRASPTLLVLMPDDARSLPLARRAVPSARDEAIVSALDGAAAILLAHEAELALTLREIEMAALVARGLSNGEIATHLYIAPSTVKVHVRKLLKKLGASTRLEAALRWSEFSRSA
jgi:DNA-binding CsgD family transcriptional regulator